MFLGLVLVGIAFPSDEAHRPRLVHMSREELGEYVATQHPSYIECRDSALGDFERYGDTDVASELDLVIRRLDGCAAEYRAVKTQLDAQTAFLLRVGGARLAAHFDQLMVIGWIVNDADRQIGFYGQLKAQYTSAICFRNGGNCAE